MYNAPRSIIRQQNTLCSLKLVRLFRPDMNIDDIEKKNSSTSRVFVVVSETYEHMTSEKNLNENERHKENEF